MQSLINRAELYKNCVRETSAVCDEGERKGGKQIVFARKKTPATHANYFIQIRRNKFLYFLMFYKNPPDLIMNHR